MVIKETISHISFQDITPVPILEETRIIRGSKEIKKQ